MNRLVLSALCSLLLLLVACDDDGSEATGSGGAGGGTAAQGGGANLVTDDGYEVIMARPKAAPGEGKQGGDDQDEDDDHLVREPTEPDPQGGSFTLEQSVKGMGTDGTLVAELNTDLGTIFCDLFAEKAPKNVANFIGLARGKRSFWDARAGAWVERRYYDGTTFHRVIPDYLIQGGDYLGDGTGRVGYTVAHESHPTLRHDEAGQLCMASHEDGNGAQFFITDGPAPKLDDEEAFTIIGSCEQTDIVKRIARVPQSGRPDYKPLTPVPIERVFIKRVRGGAKKATRTPPHLRDGTPVEDMSDLQGRGASRGPSELDAPREERETTPEPPE